MSKLTLAAVLLLGMTASALADDTYELQSWPQDIDLIPCSAWTKESDGTWALHGTLRVRDSVIDNVGVKGDAAARAVEKECGAKAEKTNAPANDADTKSAKKKKKKKDQDKDQN
jgi:hypothetical protein